MSAIVFHEFDSPVYPSWLDYKHGLKLMLWAGDGLHDGICDIERLSNYDVFLCAGYSGYLDVNITYLKEHFQGSKVICIVDIKSPGQLASFCSLFRSRFAVIDSDYIGNTPHLDLDTYSVLLSTGGHAYNIRGINGLSYPDEEFLNVLELFAPVLPDGLYLRRTWTAELLQLARDNRLSPSFTWSSPDLVHPFYDGVRERQTAFTANQLRMSRGSYHARYTYNAATMEDYWATLSTEILTTNIQRGWRMTHEPDDLINGYKERFAVYLRSLVIADAECQRHAQSENVDEEIALLQKCIRLTRYFEGRTIPGSLTRRVATFADSRWNPLRETFDIILTK
jgi:hypothetical protein